MTGLEKLKTLACSWGFGSKLGTEKEDFDLSRNLLVKYITKIVSIEGLWGHNLGSKRISGLEGTEIRKDGDRIRMT